MADPDQNHGLGGDDEAANLAEKLGLKQQAIRYQMSGTDIRTIFANYRLSEVELTVWRNYCPTSYVEGTEEFGAYRFETVPLPVLKHWNELKQKHPFDRFEIWTTEQPARTVASDPLLLGVFEGAFYLLARWGKEEKDLLSYSEVRDRVYDRFHRGFSLKNLPAKVADTVRRLQSEHLGGVIRYEYWDTRFFLPRKHCGEKILAFYFRNHSNSILSICPSCGGTNDIGH